MWPFKKSLEQLAIELAEKIARNQEITKQMYELNNFPLSMVEQSFDLVEEIACLQTKIKFMQLNEKLKELKNV